MDDTVRLYLYTQGLITAYNFYIENREWFRNTIELQNFISNPNLYINQMSLSFVNWYRRRQSYRRGTRGQRSRLAGANLHRRVRKLERGQSGKEIKLHDFASAALTYINTGVVEYVTGIAQGDTSLTREGLKMALHSIHFKFQTITNTANPAGTYRIILFLDRVQLGSLPAVADVLETASYRAWKEHDELGRFRILMDKTFVKNEVVANDVQHKFKKYYKRFKKPVIVEYRGTTNGIASAGKNNLFILVIGSDTANAAVLNAYARLRFTD